MIKLFITDIDGCLTNGQIFYLANKSSINVEGIKSFNVLDGAAILKAQKQGMQIAIISGRSSDALAARAKDLGINYLFMGVKDKLSCAKAICADLGISLEKEVAVLGDDLIDLKLLKASAYAFIPNDARPLFGHRLSRAGGAGCLFEALEFICSQGL